MLLDLSRELAPKGNEKLHESFYVMKKIVGDLEFLYEKLMMIVLFIEVTIVV